MLDGGGGRSVEPIERAEAVEAHGVKQQSGGGKIGARDFGGVVGRTAGKVFGGIEAHHAAGAGSSGAARALFGRSLADAGHLKSGQPRPWRMARHAREAAIDNGGDAFNGDGAFRHVGGENDFPLLRRPHGAVLFLGRLVAMQGQQQPAVSAGERRTGGLPTADFGCSGQEDEHVARQPAGGQPFQGRGPLRFERRGGMRRILDFQRILTALGLYHTRATQVLRHGSGVERGGHDEQAQVRTLGPLETAQ